MKGSTWVIIIGLVLMAFVGVIGWSATSIPELIGMFLPGFICLIIGLKMRENNTPRQNARTPRPDEMKDLPS
jgi:hypothetical protein